MDVSRSESCARRFSEGSLEAPRLRAMLSLVLWPLLLTSFTGCGSLSVAERNSVIGLGAAVFAGRALAGG